MPEDKRRTTQEIKRAEDTISRGIKRVEKIADAIELLLETFTHYKGVIDISAFDLMRANLIESLEEKKSDNELNESK